MRAVLERDFLALAVRRRSFWARVATASLVAVVILLVLEDNSHYLDSNRDRLARYLFAGGGIALLSLLALLTPPAVIGSILEERQRDTLPLVLTTPVGPRSFALAKLLARSATVLAWGLAAAVPLAMVLTMGGVSGREVLDLGLLCVAVVLELAAWSLWLSTVSRRTATAAVLAFLLPAVRWGLTTFLWAVLVIPGGPFRNETRVGEAAWSGWAVGNTTPVPALVRASVPDEHDDLLRGSYSLPKDGPGAASPAGGPSSRPIFHHPSALYLLFASVAAALAVLVAGRRLRTEAEPRAPSLLARWKRGRRALRPPPGEGNPVAWKERRLLNTAASRPLYYTVLAVLLAGEVVYLLVALFGLRREREHAEVAAGWVSAYAPLLGLVSVIGCATAMAHERATGTLDLVRASRISALEFFRGKVLGSFLGPTYLALLPAAHIGIVLVTGAVDPATAGVALLQVLLSVAFWGVVGIHCGLAARRIGTAVTRASLLFGALLVALPLLAATANEIFRAHDLAEFFVAACPPATAWFTMEASLRSFHPAWDYYASFGHGRLNDEHDWAVFWTAVAVALTVAGGFLARRRAARLWEAEREDGG